MPISYSGAYIIPDGIETIAGFAFYGCSGLTSIEIPNSVTSIGDYAFNRCIGLSFVEIPNSVTNIGSYAFQSCSGLTNVTIPNSITRIGDGTFDDCNSLTSMTIENMKYKIQEIVDGKCKAYKAFNADMTCRDFQYEEGKTYEFDDDPKLCKCGFHACLNFADVFNYYHGMIGQDIVVYEVELEGVSDKRNKYNSKVVAKKITIGKRIL